MLRRDFALAAVAVMAAPAVVQAAEVKESAIDTQEQAQQIAQMFADMELNGIRHNNPDDWKSLCYVKRAQYDCELSLLYCVSHDWRFIERFAARVTAAMDNSPNMPLFAIAKAGGAVIPGKEGDDGFHPVLMSLVSTDGLNKNMGYFADLIATSKGLPNA